MATMDTHHFVKDVPSWDLPTCVDEDGSHDNAEHHPADCPHREDLRRLEPNERGGFSPTGPAPIGPEPGWEMMQPTNKDRRKVASGTKLSVERLAPSLIGDGAPRWAWDCPYMRCGFELRGAVLEPYSEVVVKIGQHIAERHTLVSAK